MRNAGAYSWQTSVCPKHGSQYTTPFLFTNAHKAQLRTTSAQDAWYLLLFPSLRQRFSDAAIAWVYNGNSEEKCQNKNASRDVQEATHSRGCESFSRWKFDIFRWQWQYVNPLWGAGVLVSFNLEQDSHYKTVPFGGYQFGLRWYAPEESCLRQVWRYPEWRNISLAASTRMSHYICARWLMIS